MGRLAKKDKQEPIGCRYITGDPKYDRDWEYCQQPIHDKFLCEHHHSICWIKQPVSRARYHQVVRGGVFYKVDRKVGKIIAKSDKAFPKLALKED